MWVYFLLCAVIVWLVNQLSVHEAHTHWWLQTFVDITCTLNDHFLCKAAFFPVATQKKLQCLSHLVFSFTFKQAAKTCWLLSKVNNSHSELMCWNKNGNVNKRYGCVCVCLCVSACSVCHAGRKLLVQGKTESWADGRPVAHRFSCSQELISLSSTLRVAMDTHAHAHTQLGRLRWQGMVYVT